MSGGGGFGKMYAEVGFKPAESVLEKGFLELIGGRVYMDCARMPGMFAENYPFAYDLELLRKDPDAAQQPPGIAKGTMREVAAAAEEARAVVANLREIAETLDQRFDEEFVPAVRSWCDHEGSCHLDFLDREALGALWTKMHTKVLDEFGVMAFLPSMIEALAGSDLLEFLEEHSWEEDPRNLLNQLVVSRTTDQTSLANERLQDLGQGKIALEEWLSEFGFRGPGEFDLSKPRWHERPEDVVKMAARLAGEDSLRDLHERRRKEAEEARERVLASLSEELREELARRVDLACRYVRFREDGKCQLMRAYARLRRVALEIGRRLEIGDDVFLLESDEMVEALNSGFVMKDRIELRRIQRKAEAGLSLARVIAEEDLASLGKPPVDEGSSSHDAHSLSSGMASGKALIVLAPEEVGDLGDDYILVCPSTDPSWTPLFVGASGLILECGGALSHGAIVARELGLPAVVLENATRLFTDGDELTLDANQGRVIRGSEVATDEALAEDDPTIPRDQQPPLPGGVEKAAGRRGLLAGLGWAVFLLAVWFLPAPWLQDPLFGFLDVVLWPLVSGFGMPATVALIAIFFSVVPLLLQKRYTDNERLLVARDRAAALRSEGQKLPKGSARRKAMERLAGPVTMRVLKAAMTSLAFVLGPMMLIFLWLPARLDPASWNSEPGQVVNILAEIEGDWSQALTLDVPAPLELDATGKESQTLPPIRKTLETIRAEWALASSTSEYPWEIQASATQAHQTMLASLDRFLAGPTPSQKISWRIKVPADARGHHDLRLETEGGKAVDLTLAFGKNCPPTLAEVTPTDGPVISLKAIYPRPLQKNYFWAPFPSKTGSPFDFGWLGVYLIAYLPAMVVVKKLLKVA